MTASRGDLPALTEAELREVVEEARSIVEIGYEPWDQKRLGEPPWSGPDLDAWEAAHGHDVRLKCYPEFGCQVEQVSIARALLILADRQTAAEQRLRDALARVKALADQWEMQLASYTCQGCASPNSVSTSPFADELRAVIAAALGVDEEGK